MLDSLTAHAGLLNPRPEYPRPDWERTDWLNLNGSWSFRLDQESIGASEAWQLKEESHFGSTIVVPFSWSSPLSGVGENVKGTGWYRRTVSWAPSEAGSLVFLRFGAVDYDCEVWVNGTHAGSHQGGYGTFEFDVTSAWKTAEENVIVVRAQDEDHTYQARGKQGYGEIRGIWQTVWLEARPEAYIQHAKFHTFIDGRVEISARISAARDGEARLAFDFGEGSVTAQSVHQLKAGDNEVAASFQVAEPQLWSPDTPHLYEGAVTLTSLSGEDRVSTYFGIREIGSARFGERGYRWLTLNGKPVYLNGTLDQAYHKTGYFTYPSDEDMRDEIYMMKRLGLNFVRIHIKPEEPRKLYWADKLGILVMEDMPCFWGDPDETARASYDREALETIQRDCNHPSIFSWVMFNETWGLKTDSRTVSVTGDSAQQQLYLPETQEWVRDRYRWAKSIDPTRIVEDNSPCNWDHVESDINTWHFYINGYQQLRDHLEHVVSGTFPGSELNYIGGNKQSDAPLMNSECGNVWGIEGGAGDSDLAWHYRYMLNEFRRHDKLCGFVFTEFRDVTNEFNGYYRLDGSAKDFGYDGIVPGMTLRDLHSADFIVVDAAPCVTTDAGAEAAVPLLRSSFSDRYHGERLTLEWELAYDELGVRRVESSGVVQLDWDGYGTSPLQPLVLTMPQRDALAILSLRLVDGQGKVVTRNFTAFDVRSGQPGGEYGADGGTLSIPVGSFSEHSFAHQWEAIGGHKQNGGKEGSFVFEAVLPDAGEQALITDVDIWFEASSKRLLARNYGVDKEQRTDINYMHGDSADSEWNRNTYPMTGEHKHESRVEVLIDGERAASFVLPDDPADARGILSWHYQPAANKLNEAGSYGYLCRASLPPSLTAKLDTTRRFKLELRASEGGLALYGRNAGRYPVDLVVRYR
ncbi:glycoside hydrolase family 2 protein [Paenibacillus humicus]|uniref:glycoside hydrolase family 2 protein n=1 Tax=Paenibacillus humicus TaxID=412861 RepID=UPI003F158A46